MRGTTVRTALVLFFHFRAKGGYQAVVLATPGIIEDEVEARTKDPG